MRRCKNCDKSCFGRNHYCSKLCKNQANYNRRISTGRFVPKGCYGPFDRPCKNCGKSPISMRKFCSVECRELWHYGEKVGLKFIDCAGCGKRFLQNAPQQTHCNRKCYNKHFVTSCANCRVCGKTFNYSYTKQSGEFCSKSCAISARFADRRNLEELTLGVSYAVFVYKCDNCNVRITSDKFRMKRFCSEICAKSFYAETGAVIRRSRWSPKIYLCVNCHSPFATQYGRGVSKRNKFCSKKCCVDYHRRINRVKDRLLNKAKHRATYKKRLNAAFIEQIDPLMVLERDNWRCQICGCETPWHLRGSYDDAAPEIDHIVPLSKGGEHSYLNVQCACRRCNLLKGSDYKAA